MNRYLTALSVLTLAAAWPLTAHAQLTLYLAKLKPRVTVWALKDEKNQTYLGSASYEWSGPAAPGNPFDLNAPVQLPPAELQRLHQQIAAKLHLPESVVAGARHEPMETRRVVPADTTSGF